jgi:hypothetical protein
MLPPEQFDRAHWAGIVFRAHDPVVHVLYQRMQLDE